VSENRFFQSFCALVGAATLVCGTHLFLLATSDWDAPTLNIEPPPATAAISIELSSGSAPAGPVAKLDVTPAPVAERPAPQSDAPQFTASREEHPQIVAEGHIGDRPALASASATTSVEPATKDELPQPAVESQQPKAASEDIEKPTPTPIRAAESKPEQPSPQVPLPKRASRAAKEKPASKPAAKPERATDSSSRAALEADGPCSGRHTFDFSLARPAETTGRRRL
jgi:hypothetical protein